MLQVLVWWVILTLLGWAAWPLGFRLFGRLPGRGYAFSRALGLLLASYLLWAGASLRILQNDLGGITLSLLSVAAVSLWLLLRPAGSLPEMRAFVREHWRMLAAAELLFALAFAAWALLRAGAADKIMPAGGEKFMEMAFVNGILNSRQFPPLDPWLSGYAISYYYFGYVMIALLARLSGAAAGVAFELNDALLFALTLLGAFGLVYDLAAASRASRRGSTLAGLLGALLAAGVGNLQGFLEVLYARGWLPAGFARWLAVPGFPEQAQVTGTFDPGSFFGWAWRASRVLNDLDLAGKPVPYQPITEFPAFSFLLGDNHPHVLALPFALLAAGAALQLHLTALQGGRLRFGQTAWMGLLLGALIFLNTWDYPIYLGLALLAWLAGAYAAEGALNLRQAWQAARLGLALAGWGLLFYLPFLTGFSSQAGGLLPYIFPPTRLAQYLVMFAPFIFVLALFLPASLARQNPGSARPFTLRRCLLWWLRLAGGLAAFFGLLLALTALVLALDGARGGQLNAALAPYLGGSLREAARQALLQRLSSPWLFLLLSALITLAAAGVWSAPRSPTDGARQPADPGLLFARLLALTGLALTFLVEFVYLRDGFGLRMNSVFKFYFQGWVLLACASAYAAWWLVARLPRSSPLRTAFLVGGAALLLAGLVFPLAGVSSRTNGFTTPLNLDGTSNLRRENPDDWAAIDWLLEHGREDGQPPLLLEAPGASYTYAGRISAFTGYPALLGWAVHEMQWRGSYAVQGAREGEIAEIYTTPDPGQALARLRALGVRYVILGGPEREYIRQQCSLPERACSPAQAEAKFDSALITAFRQGSVTVYRVP